MKVRIGPVKTTDMAEWLRFSRRIGCDLRTDPGDMASHSALGQVREWNKLLDEWAEELESGEPGDSLLASDDGSFNWDGEFDPDRAEYLMHSMQKTIHSATVHKLVTADDLRKHGWLTMHVMQRFIESLASEGAAHEEYVDQLRQIVKDFGARIEEHTSD
ncbi:MAG: hypothetical protein HKN03_15645 [Acidimicrobiales bacterium]|nr:hypothetical protein [Acidimicrobiales bacterium]